MDIDWDRLIEAGIKNIPEKFRDKIENVAVLLEEEPSVEVRKREGLGENETLLGLYQGVPVSVRGEGYGVGETLPDTITLYKRPILMEAEETDGDVGRVVTETIWHEFGHYFGLDEDEVQHREHEKGWH
jgi:predicted Zn-dependent protease with MMP-like domain